jgi:hypothetical protein
MMLTTRATHWMWEYISKAISGGEVRPPAGILASPFPLQLSIEFDTVNAWQNLI